MKKCSRCKKRKDFSNFNFKNKKLELLQSSCKECTRKEVKNHYKKNREYYLLKARKRNRLHRQIIKEFIWHYLSKHPCIDCGEKDPIVLEFDHQKDKIAAVSVLIKGNYPISTIKKEIEKCKVRCANCHRKKTAITHNWYKHTQAPVA